MFIQQIFLFVDDSTKKSDENQTPDSESANDNTLEPLMLTDWESRKNNIIAYNIPESELVNNDDVAADKLRKFQQSIAKQYDVKTDDSSYIVSAKSKDFLGSHVI